MINNQVNADKMDILVVDDTPINLRLLSNLLNERGYEVRKAISGKLALLAAASHPPDLILLDIMMPEMDGYEVCQQLKASPITCDVPVIFLSALDDVADKMKAFDCGGADYITKPFQVKEVMARVENQLTILQQKKQLKAQNIWLQKEIQERQETELLLKAQREKFQEALQELKRTQSQLVQTEKMSSLGQLVAGLAHEINNPVTFIGGNINHAYQYMQDLMDLIGLYQVEYPHQTPAIEEALELLDLAYVKGDLEKIIESMKVGVERIRNIIRSLQNFSRLDQAQVKPVDLHEGIDSTLILLQSRLINESGKSKIQVVKRFAELPRITCYPAEINQVFMNILANAIDALEEAIQKGFFVDKNPLITVCTKLEENDLVVVNISDNGMGISEEVKNQIFNPFFTTKPVGRGTGLGLSISYSIVVEAHGGQLNCFSIPGQGAEFKIALPLNVDKLIK
ncbi:response regulator [Ancylothrix sp. C2]|uniref:hybrid sensor histidine kinase/response regulator n=1 Tax=Ancylothrix sp. D3o TaxID=2953691 RepID=UPI0021BBB112|nr:response regulator [Ancylothrix sp. D3o]MCT7951756.1 response regulator [Ancylothrix sp. D3o]